MFYVAQYICSCNFINNNVDNNSSNWILDIVRQIRNNRCRIINIGLLIMENGEYIINNK